MQLEESIQQHVMLLPPHLKAKVLDFVLFLERKQAQQAQETLPIEINHLPITQSLIGILKDSNLDIIDYQQYLENKYL